jgi:hypothetical protein
VAAIDVLWREESIRLNYTASEWAAAAEVGCGCGQRFEAAQAMNAPVASAPMAMRPKLGTWIGGRTILPP